MRASVRNTIPSTKVSFNSALPSPPFFTINSSNSGLWEWSWEVMSHCLLTQLWISRLDLFNPIAQRLSGNLFNPFEVHLSFWTYRTVLCFQTFKLALSNYVYKILHKFIDLLQFLEFKILWYANCEHRCISLKGSFRKFDICNIVDKKI